MIDRIWPNNLLLNMKLMFEFEQISILPKARKILTTHVRVHIHTFCYILCSHTLKKIDKGIMNIYRHNNY